MARDFGVSVGVAGQLSTAATLVGALAALAAGTLSDFYGRRLFLVAGPVLTGMCTMAFAWAPDLVWALATRAASGLGFVLPVVMAAVGDWYEGSSRDRAVARVVVFDALAWVAGIPVLSVVAQFGGWRSAAFALGAVVAALGALAWYTVPNGVRRRGAGDGFRTSISATLAQHRGRPDLALLLAANGLRNTYWIGLVTYVGAMFTLGSSLATWQVGFVLALGAVAYIAGAELGAGRAVSARPRAVVAGACVASGALAILLPKMGDLPAAIAVMLVFAACSGTAFSAMSALVLRLAPSSRGFTVALNGATGNLGAALGVAVGGFGLSTGGYVGLSYSVAGFAVLAATCTLLSARGRSKL